MQVALYARSASKEQTGQASVEKQLKVLREFAKENNYLVKKEYIDIGQSGNEPQRPQLNKLTEDAEKKKFALIIAKDVTRLSRNVKDYTALRDFLNRKQIKVIFTDYKFDVSAEAQFMEEVRAAAEELHKKFLRREILAAGLKRSKKAKTPAVKQEVFKHKTH